MSRLPSGATAAPCHPGYAGNPRAWISSLSGCTAGKAAIVGPPSTPFVGGAVAVVVDAVAADLRRAGVDGGVAVVAVLAPADAVAVGIVQMGRAVLAVDPGLHERGPILDDGTLARHRLLEPRHVRRLVRIVGDGARDLRRPRVDPGLDLADVP